MGEAKKRAATKAERAAIAIAEGRIKQPKPVKIENKRRWMPLGEVMQKPKEPT